MVKASALYIVIIIALVIGILCSSLIVVAYFYRYEYQKKFRQDHLQNNLSSGINILLAATDQSYSKPGTLSLFGNGDDSVSLQKFQWGVYDIGVVKAFIQHDTLYKAFSMANTIDTSKWAALYLLDDDRPVSVSGKTVINGDAYLPKAGIQEAYVDNRAYEGDKRLVLGKKYISKKKLPPLDSASLIRLGEYFSAKGDTVIGKDSVEQSFLKPIKVYDLKKSVQPLQHVTLSGNIIIRSDTTLTIDNSASLKDVLVFARTIIIKSGFKGNCQLFARDSISVEQDCHFSYPSCLAIIRLSKPKVNAQARIVLNADCTLSGHILMYEANPSELKPRISIGEKDTVTGNIYSQNILELKKESVTSGSIFTGRFLYRTSFTTYENYIINTTLNERTLSPYYLTSQIVPVASKKKKILQWLEGN